MSTRSRTKSVPNPPFRAVYYPPWLGWPLPRTLTPSQAKHLYLHIKTVAFYLDALSVLIPQTRDFPVQFGLEPIIAAFIPLAGPVLAALFGVYIILLSLLFGISSYDVSRMVINIGIDMGAGYVPLLGTMVDVIFKANLANLAILEAHIRRTPKYVCLNLSPPRTWWQSWRGTENWGSQGPVPTASGL